MSTPSKIASPKKHWYPERALRFGQWWEKRTESRGPLWRVLISLILMVVLACAISAMNQVIEPLKSQDKNLVLTHCRELRQSYQHIQASKGTVVVPEDRDSVREALKHCQVDILETADMESKDWQGIVGDVALVSALPQQNASSSAQGWPLHITTHHLQMLQILLAALYACFLVCVAVIFLVFVEWLADQSILELIEKINGGKAGEASSGGSARTGGILSLLAPATLILPGALGGLLVFRTAPVDVAIKPLHTTLELQTHVVAAPVPSSSSPVTAALSSGAVPLALQATFGEKPVDVPLAPKVLHPLDVQVKLSPVPLPVQWVASGSSGASAASSDVHQELLKAQNKLNEQLGAMHRTQQDGVWVLEDFTHVLRRNLRAMQSSTDIRLISCGLELSQNSRSPCVYPPSGY